MSQDYPPTSFCFSVRFEHIGASDIDFRFQSVSGLTAEVVTETYREGGQNIKDHVLPVKTQYPDLVLKRGLATRSDGNPIYVPELAVTGLTLPGNRQGAFSDSNLQQWCLQMMESLTVQPTDITISLLNTAGHPLMTWNVKRAWPKKWAISDFNAEENQLAIETMEFNYFYFTII